MLLKQRGPGRENRRGTRLCRPLTTIVSHLVFPLNKMEIHWRAFSSPPGLSHLPLWVLMKKQYFPVSGLHFINCSCLLPLCLALWKWRATGPPQLYSQPSAPPGTVGCRRTLLVEVINENFTTPTLLFMT